MRLLLAAALAATTALSLPNAAFADRAPTASERAAIESALRSQGYVRWGEIELDDGRWEVDDAVFHDRRKFELKLDRTTLQVLRRERDD